MGETLGGSAYLGYVATGTEASGNIKSWNDGISLIIPAYNEENRIRSTLEGYIPVLKSLGMPFEIIVVADGNDNTTKIAEEFSSSGVRAYRFNRRLGKGGAIKTGFCLSSFSVVGYVDADGSLAPRDLARLVAGLESSDCVIASRWIRGSVWTRKEPALKRSLSRLFNFLVRGLLGVPIYDTQCGAKFYRKEILQRILPKVTVTNLTTDVDFLFHARKLGATITEVPITWEDKEGSRFSMFRMVTLMLITVIGIRVMNLPLRDYVPEKLVHLFYAKYGNQ
ncbi:MAG: glycosyltransferase family 2 protein [Candidatus Thermoplasmatota archaeon]|nr:glycosyltransferase family 2 protein [Candidatus Thermoplasmatota archaeon]